tara:strand:- start:172 stop:1230 length:1059 start_codon:yes stop_codon:yes gene_type:complete
MSRVAVGLSGGVDSSVTAALLKEEGHEVIGLGMRLYDNPVPDSRSCCSPDDLFDARYVADLLDIPYYTLDFREVFRSAVMEPWAAGYRQGLTPNPCIACNGTVKFQALAARADLLQCDFLATGHFARVEEVDGRHRLGRARHRAKDQSYFLYPVPADRLARFLLPLGNWTKEEVRARASTLGLPTAKKRESQDACFVTPREPHEVVAEISGEPVVPGAIVTKGGERLGTHKGFEAYTIGQRKGLGLAGGPWFVTDLRPETNEVVVQKQQQRTLQRLRIDDAFWHIEPQEMAVSVRTRSGAEPVPARLLPQGDGGLVVAFEDPVSAPAPGQVAVAYDGDWIVCGGPIRWLPGA